MQARRRKPAQLLKFFAVDFEFIDYFSPDKSSIDRRLTLYQASALGKWWFPPIRDEAGGAWRRQA
jgi:hypothetical protein